jgi:putative ABC transport system substrate-binding protein
MTPTFLRLQAKALVLLITGLFLSSVLFAAHTNYTKAPKKVYHVAITQFADTLGLNESYAGIIAGLKERGYVEGKNLKITFMNAQGDFEATKKIAEDFVKQKPDLIIPISTPSTQAVVNADHTAQIPVVFSTVTDPVVTKIVPSLTQSGGYVTGVYDLPSVDQQVALLRETMPNLQTLGVVYNPNEENSARILELFEVTAKPIKIIVAEATSASHVMAAVESLMGKVEAVFIPSDSTVQSSMEALLKITMNNRIPVFTSDDGSVRMGALAAFADNQYDVGYLAGRRAGSVLSGMDPGKMDVVRIPHQSLFINMKTAKALNINIPEKVLAKAAQIIQ